MIDFEEMWEQFKRSEYWFPYRIESTEVYYWCGHMGISMETAEQFFNYISEEHSDQLEK